MIKIVNNTKAIEIVNDAKAIEIVKPTEENTQEAYKKGYAEGDKEGYKRGNTDGYSSGYSKGKTAGIAQGKNERDIAFWDEYLAPDESGLIYGSYLFAGCGITQDMLKTIYSNFETKKYHNAYSMFRSNSRITDLWNFRFNLQECTDTDYMFSSCENLRRIYSFRFSDLEKAAARTFRYCHSLHTIYKIFFSENTTSYNEVFQECYALEKIGAQGTINGTGLHFEDCPLDLDSILSIIACLKKQPTGSTKVITFGADNLAKLTAGHKAMATRKGWTLK